MLSTFWGRTSCFLVLFLAGLGGCAEEAAVTRSNGECTPGTQQMCACPDDSMGKRWCNNTGEYEPCECAPEIPDAGMPEMPDPTCDDEEKNGNEVDVDCEAHALHVPMVKRVVPTLTVKRKTVLNRCARPHMLDGSKPGRIGCGLRR